MMIGEKVSITNVFESIVDEDVSDVLGFPAYRVYDRMTNRKHVIYFNKEYHNGDGAWMPLPKDMAIKFFAIRPIRKPSEIIKAHNSSTKHSTFGYKRHKIYPVADILPILKTDARRSNDKEYIDLDGVKVKITSLRYEVFKKSVKCVCCGIEGTFFASERANEDTDKYHFNLYGISDGKEFLITKDHIIPRSKGGKDHISNMQTMCAVCNAQKGNRMME